MSDLLPVLFGAAFLVALTIVHVRDERRWARERERERREAPK